MDADDRMTCRVSDLPLVRYGETEWLRDRVVDLGVPVAEGRANSELLYGSTFPRDAAVLGVLHDATIELDLHAREQDLPAPDAGTIEEEFFGRLLDGKPHRDGWPRGDHVHGRLAALEAEHGVAPQAFLGTEAYGRPVTDYIADIAETRAADWNPLGGTDEVETERWVETDWLSGRADIVADGTVRETKMVAARDPELPRERDLYQAAIYAVMADAETYTVDYPVQGEEYGHETDIGETYRMVMEDRFALGDMVHELREAQAAGIADATGIEREPYEDAGAYRDRAAETYDGDLAEVLEPVTRDAAAGVVG